VSCVVFLRPTALAWCQLLGCTCVQCCRHWADMHESCLALVLAGLASLLAAFWCQPWQTCYHSGCDLSIKAITKVRIPTELAACSWHAGLWACRSSKTSMTAPSHITKQTLSTIQTYHSTCHSADNKYERYYAIPPMPCHVVFKYEKSVCPC
jgi:hypothetical protein